MLKWTTKLFLANWTGLELNLWSSGFQFWFIPILNSDCMSTTLLKVFVFLEKLLKFCLINPKATLLKLSLLNKVVLQAMKIINILDRIYISQIILLLQKWFNLSILQALGHHQWTGEYISFLNLPAISLIDLNWLSLKDIRFLTISLSASPSIISILLPFNLTFLNISLSRDRLWCSIKQ